LATPNVPTDSIYRINLPSLFSGNVGLKSKLLTISVDKKSLDSSS